MNLKSDTTIKGHLVINEVDKQGNVRKVFDNSNVVTSEGKNHIIRFLTSRMTTPFVPIDPIQGMFLSSNPSPQDAGDTFNSMVRDYIVDSGVLHTENSGDGKQVNLEGISLNNSFVLKGRIDYDQGNTEPNNVIRSCAVVFGADLTTGYLTPYIPNGTEALLARVTVGSLVKQEENAYTFTWTFFIT